MKFEPIHVPYLHVDMPEKIKKMGRKLQDQLGPLETDRNSLIEDDRRLRATPPEEVGPRLKTDLDDIGTRHLELLQRELVLRKEIAEFFSGHVKQALHALADSYIAEMEQIKADLEQRLTEAGYVNLNETHQRLIVSWNPKLREAQRKCDEATSTNWSVNEIEIGFQAGIQATKDKIAQFVANYTRAVSIPA